jgi:hypothetical protein
MTADRRADDADIDAILRQAGREPPGCGPGVCRLTRLASPAALAASSTTQLN